MSRQAWQLEAQGPRAYERYLVPAFFAPCADQLVEAAALVPGERVLDVACGTGIVARRAAARVGATGAVTGLDLNQGMLEVAATVAAGTQPAIDWRRGDATALPLPDGAVDVVLCQQGLQFFPDPAAAVGELRRVLAPAGRAAIAVWRFIEHNPAFVVLTEALERHLGTGPADLLRSPFAAGDPEPLRALLGGAGFRDPHLAIGILAARFPSVEEFLRQEAAASPLAEHVETLDASRLEGLLDDLRTALGPYRDDRGVAFPMQTWLVTARR
jgi:SAM-dependent methyltransferase